MSSPSDSALVRPFRGVIRFVGAFVDAVYYFIDSLFNPGSNRHRLTDSRRFAGSSGPRIGVLRPGGESRNNAPNMSMGGCRSCM